MKGVRVKHLCLIAALWIAASPAAAQDDEPVEDKAEAFVPANLAPSGNAIVAGLNRFAFDMFGELRTEKGDLAFSPASASTAFGLAYAGARGATAKELASVLRYPNVPDFHASFGKLLGTMQLRQNGRTMSVNNALWLQSGMPVHQDYLSLVERHYGAGVQQVDYKADPNAARERINKWVESKTNDRIKNLLSPSNVTTKTRSYLVNTIYFKADWADQFDAKATKSKDFKLAGGGIVKRKMMHRQHEYAFVAERGVKALAMRYRGGETEMVLFLPDARNGLPAFERSLDAAAFDGWLTKLDDRQATVNVTLPKFKLETRMDLLPPLKALGLSIALSDASDFSGAKVVNATSPNQEDWNLKIDNVLQQVFVEVEEKGTEAAAATAVGAILVVGKRMPIRVEEFRADHPFLFVLRDRRTKAILFIGRYTGEST
jgi:serpin B